MYINDHIKILLLPNFWYYLLFFIPQTYTNINQLMLITLSFIIDNKLKYSLFCVAFVKTLKANFFITKKKD